jgi:hypothetical protein
MWREDGVIQQYIYVHCHYNKDYSSSCIKLPKDGDDEEDNEKDVGARIDPFPEKRTGGYGIHDKDTIWSGARFSPGIWYQVKIQVRLNSYDYNADVVGEDGFIRGWLNGERCFNLEDILLRDRDFFVSEDGSKLDPCRGIEGLFFSTFFGGNTPDFAPTIDCYALFDSFLVTT